MSHPFRQFPFFVRLHSVVGLGLILLLTSCSRGAADAAAPGGPGAPAAEGRGAGRGGARGAGGGAVAVSVTTVVQKPMPVNVRALGNVEASSTVEIRAQVTGALTSVDFKEGQDVAAGQLLFTLDSRPFEVALRQAEAQLQRDTASASNADAQLARMRDLSERGLSSRADLDTSTAQANALKGTLAADTAAVENARLQLQYTKIRAPVSGRAGALLVHAGSLVRANDTQPLVIINQLTPAYVSFAVPARLLPQLGSERRVGTLTVRAAPSGTTADASTGTVTFIDNAVDQATDTVRVKATFTNRDRRLWPGAFVDVTLQLSVNPKAIVVPTSAVQPSQQGQMVYVVKADQTVEARQVKVAWTDGDNIVIDTGLQAGETVVVDGQLRLTPGARVSVKPAAGGPRSAS
jgi:multidrug efflux system membrane fusion protein